MRALYKLISSFTDIPGWRTKRHIVVIESDDWGSIRMPSIESYNRLLAAGIRVDKCHYCTNDTVASTDDLELLFEVLTSVKDKNGKAAVITANSLVANPDFDRIKNTLKTPVIFDGRNQYNSERLLEKGFDYTCIGSNNQ